MVVCICENSVQRWVHKREKKARLFNSANERGNRGEAQEFPGSTESMNVHPPLQLPGVHHTVGANTRALWQFPWGGCTWQMNRLISLCLAAADDIQ